MANFSITGPAGALELALELPTGEWAQSPRGLALVAHPHPLHGGTMDNKVVTTLARACAQQGFVALRFNYRGVGHSAGTYDAARGEVDDAACALAYLRAKYPNLMTAPLVLCGFSFGTAIVTQLALRPATGAVAGMVLAGAAVQRFASNARVNPDTTLLIHGERDETVPLAETLAWCAPQALPVTVIPAADHFFNRQLLPLRACVTRFLRLI